MFIGIAYIFPLRRKDAAATSPDACFALLLGRWRGVGEFRYGHRVVFGEVTHSSDSFCRQNVPNILTLLQIENQPNLRLVYFFFLGRLRKRAFYATSNKKIHTFQCGFSA